MINKINPNTKLDIGFLLVFRGFNFKVQRV